MIPQQAVLLDLDGTVYRGSEVVPHAPEVVAALLEAGKHVRYLTNNSAARPEKVTAKLTAMGVPCEPSWVYSSGIAAARFCRENNLDSVFIVGQPDLLHTFQEAGIHTTDQNPQAVVVGICRSFTYELMDQAMQHIRAGAKFIATNPDPTFPLEGGRFSPGAGSIVAAVKTAAGVEPFLIGKPQPTLALHACADLGITPDQALLVGDRLDTDIHCGEAAGCATWLVLTGVETSIPPNQPGSPDLRGLI